MNLTRRGFLLAATGLTIGLAAGCGPPAGYVSPPTAVPKRNQGSERANKPADLWNGSGLDSRLLFQREIDQLPEAPHMLRVTELEMAPGASIDPHTHLGPGVQVVLSGAFAIVEADTSVATVFEPTATTPFPVFSTGMLNKYSTENRGSTDNRLFMAEILPQSREFLGNQQFDRDGVVHNHGGVRSGPYVQVKLESLPQGPLMVRVSQIDMGPKAKTPEYTRAGPAVFFVVGGQATFRRQSDLLIATQGAGGYVVDEGEPIVLENKPITPNRIVAVEFLPAALGKQPSTVPTGREI